MAKHKDVQAFQDAVQRLVAKEGLTREKATKRVCRMDPELHERFMLATNSDRPEATANIKAKFAS